jgi:hypothetical protein
MRRCPFPCLKGRTRHYWKRHFWRHTPGNRLALLVERCVCGGERIFRRLRLDEFGSLELEGYRRPGSKSIV